MWDIVALLLGFRRSYSDLTKIHCLVFIPSEMYIQRVKRYQSKKKKKMISDCPTGEKFWMLIIWTSSTAGLSLKKCKKLYHSEKCKQSSAQFIIYNVIHRSCIISYCKSFTPHDIPIYDSADGRSNWWKWNYHSNYLQDKSIDLIC